MTGALRQGPPYAIGWKWRGEPVIAPSAFRLDRTAEDHVAFGSGICIGHALARLETRVAVEILALRLPHLAPPEPRTASAVPYCADCAPFPSR